jgi:hypothetical protein
MEWLKVISTVAVLLLPGAALAETTWEAYARFGLTGTWAASCSEPASTGNWKMTYMRGAGGEAVRQADRGPGVNSLMSSVDTAQIITANTLKTRIRNDDQNWGAMNGVAFDMILVKEDGRIRTIESKGTDGREYIKDGIVVSNGRPSGWLEKCGP